MNRNHYLANGMFGFITVVDDDDHDGDHDRDDR